MTRSHARSPCLSTSRSRKRKSAREHPRPARSQEAVSIRLTAGIWSCVPLPDQSCTPDDRWWAVLRLVTLARARK